MAEEEKQEAVSEGQPESGPSKPMSKLEQARAAAKKKAAEESGEPDSTSDEPAAKKPLSKLEQARAAAREKPAAEKPGGEEATEAKPKSKLEQLRAAAGKGSGAAKPAKPPVKEAAAKKGPPPPMPKRPEASAKATAGAKAERRGVLAVLVGAGTILLIGWSAFSAACAAALGGTVRFMFPNVLTEPPSKFKIGSPADYPPDSVSTKWKSQFGVWIVNTIYNGQREVYALRTVCTHLGCTPNWLDAERKFKCPCHGSGFYITGINFEGPAPRPLERYAIRLAEDGQLEVDKSRIFQQELGGWDDAASFVIA